MPDLTMPICQGLKEREIFAVIAHRSFRPKKGLFFKWQFKYIPEKDVYLYPTRKFANTVLSSQNALIPKRIPKRSLAMFGKTQKSGHVKTV
jgi:hypothetical protein